MSKGSIGIIGLGIMGGAIARNLAAAGWRVYGYDIDAGCCQAAAQAGVQIAASVAELAAQAPTLLTSLPNPDALHSTVSAIASAGVSRRVVIEASTFSLDDKLKAMAVLDAAGHVLLDCTISGTGAQARNKDLAVYASGDSDAMRALMPLFRDYAREVYDVGAFGNGSRMKFVANLLVAIHNVASAEAMVLGMKAGLDPEKIVEVIRAGAGNSRIFELRAPLMAQNRYEPATMKVSVWQKDMHVIGDFAAQVGSPTPLLSATVPVYDAAMAQGHAAEDTASVCAVLEKQAGLKR